MTVRRRDTELSLERPLGPEGSATGSVRLTVRIEVGADGEPPSPQALAEVLEGLKADLEALIGAPLAALPVSGSDRGVVELVATYRPRQRSLVDALRDDGELTAVEHTRLLDYLATGPSVAPPPAFVEPRPEPKFDQPIAAVPIVAERSSTGTRPVLDLVRQYQISSLKQAGAVRARREISYEEYMSLKRHFQQVEAAATDRPV